MSARDVVYRCSECGADTPALSTHHRDDCLSRQLAATRKELAALKANRDDWKDAWFRQREIIGWLWWRQPDDK